MAGIARTYVGGKGSVKGGKVRGAKGLRNCRRATWAQEKFVEQLHKDRRDEARQRIIDRFDEESSDYNG